MPSLLSSAVAGVPRPATPEHYRAPGGSVPSPPGPDTAGAGPTDAGTAGSATTGTGTTGAATTGTGAAGLGTTGAGTTGAGSPRLAAAFEGRRSRQECQACGAISSTASTQMVTSAYRETRPARVTPVLPSRYPPIATTDTQAAEPSVSQSTNASSGSPAQPAAA